MKKTKLKVKKQVWIALVIMIFLGIGVYAGLNVYKEMQYKKTNEYKLLEKGYSLEEISLLNEKLNPSMVDSLTTQEKNTFLLDLFNEDFYLNKNLDKYLEYHQEYVGYDTTTVVRTINTHNDYRKYGYEIDTDISKDNLLMVNKYYHLSDTYEPDDLVIVNNKYYYGTNHKLRKDAYNAFINMWNAAYNAGIYLIMNSSYRTYESQVKVYDDYKNTKGTSYADKIAARPGYSEHQTGLALDIFSKDNTTTANFKGSPAHLWLQQNAHYYGFIERYQEGKEDITGFAAEAWHYRYVGVNAATYIYNNDITFEEYYAYFVE